MWLGQNYFVKFFFVATIYTSEKTGCDESGDGSEIKPFKTVIQVNLIWLISISNVLLDCLEIPIHYFMTKLLK